MHDEKLQFRILFRDALARLIDVEWLTAGGDPGRLLSQAAAILIAFGFTFLVITAPKYLAATAPPKELLAAARTEVHFVFATTFAVAAMLVVLAWNAILPDRRDCAILGVLPVRLRTLFLAKTSAIGASLGVAVLALNLLPGLCYPFLSGNALLGLAAYWGTLALMALFVWCALLAIQGLCVLLLSHRLFLRLSSWLQLAAFFMILAAYFLPPPDPRAWPWLPSYWFYALWLKWIGMASADLETPAARALWGLALAGVLGGVSFTLAFPRSVKRIVEQPDIAPGHRSRAAAPLGRYLVERLVADPLDRAILMFTARTMVRSRQHRLLLAAYGGIGLSVALVYVKDLLYGYTGGVWDSLGSNAAASSHWNQLNVPLLAGTLVLLCFAIAGARATFALPVALPANWIFRITAMHSPAAYFAAVRRALYALAALPVWTGAALLLFALWPSAVAAGHTAILILTGTLLVELSMFRFRKIPFACSYLPGKANLNARLGVYAILFLFVADRGVAVEHWAMQGAGFLFLLAALGGAAVWARNRTAGFANAPGNRIQFDDVADAAVFALDLRPDGAWSSDQAHVNAIQTARPAPEPAPEPAPRLTGLHLNHAPQTLVEARHPAIRVVCEQLLQDCRQAARAFRSAPAFSAVAALLITLGLGANLTIYSVIRSVLAKPAPGVHAEGLVIFGQTVDGRLAEGGPLNSYLTYLDVAANTATMSAMTASVAAPWLTAALPDGTYEIRGEMVRANYFQTLGVPLVKGRTFTEAEEQGIGGLRAIVSYAFWRDQFHGAEDIVGHTILVNGHAATIIGVTAGSFHGSGLLPRFEIGLPLPGFARVQRTEEQLADPSWRGVTILGRLKPDAGLAQAKREFAMLSQRLQAAYPDANRGRAMTLTPYTRTAFGPNSSPQVRLVMAGVSAIGLLALLAICANIASLLLGRALARRREMAVRISMGASRPRLLRMLVAEGLMLSLSACCGAWALTLWITRELGKLAPPLASGLKVTLDLAPDGRVLAYGMALTIGATLVFTLATAPGAWLRDIHPLLKGSDPAVVRHASPALNWLVIAQVALCALLAIAATLAYRSLFYIDQADLYFTRDHLLLASVNTAAAAAGGEENLALLERIRTRLRGLSGVDYVSYATAAPPHDHGWMDVPVEAQDSGRSTLTAGTIAGPDYIHVLAVPNLAGRDFSATETGASAIVNRKLAEALWPGQSALGHRILLGDGREPIEIVGVVPNGAFSGVAKDGSFTGIGKAERPNFVFLVERAGSSTPGAKTFHIRYSGELSRLIPAVRGAVHAVDARVPVFSVRTMQEEFSDFTSPIRFVTILIGLFAGTAVLLSSIGLYGAIAFHTARLSREFGIRSALGATPWQVQRAVLRQGLILAGSGVAFGITAAATVAPRAAGFLFGVDPSGAGAYAAVAAALAAIALAACYLPARRASRADPASVLRQD